MKRAMEIDLSVALGVLCNMVGGKIGPKKVVDDGNLIAFIIRYRYNHRHVCQFTLAGPKDRKGIY
jgi:hypothetical protein